MASTIARAPSCAVEEDTTRWVLRRPRPACAGSTTSGATRVTRYCTWQRQPAFAIVCLLTLAIGIGGVTSVFSVVAAVLVRPLPYAHADRLIAVWDSHVNDRNLAKIFASYSDFQTWQRESRTVEQFAAVTWAVGDRTLTGYGDARVVLAIPASVEFFTLLGVAPAIGRTFDAADLTRGCTVVLAASFWRSVLSAPGDIVGRSLALDGRACSVAGVMPDGFAFYPAAADMWMLITPTRNSFRPIAIRASASSVGSVPASRVSASAPSSRRFTALPMRTTRTVPHSRRPFCRCSTNSPGWPAATCS